MEYRIIKYPRTPHLVGSRIGVGDEDLSKIPFSALRGCVVAVEEKIDGANSAVSFSEGELYLQSRGHFLTGGARERHYEPLKLWAAANRATLYDLLGNRYVMYGEWMWAKHKLFYDELPHYFIEFDILDRERGAFLDSEERARLLCGSPICSVPLLYRGAFTSEREILSLLGRSRYVSDNRRARLIAEAERLGLDPEGVLAESEDTDLAEGLYIKVEEAGRVVGRMKYVRRGYTQLAEPESRWHSRPIIPNRLREGVNFP